MNKSLPKPAMVAVDLDNITVSEGGFDIVDIPRFMNRVVAEVGRNCIVNVFANGMPLSIEKVWNRCGATITRTKVNADPFIEDFLFEGDDVSSVLVVSGDHFFTNVCSWHASLGHRVIVWARARKASYDLVFGSGAARIDFIDDLIINNRKKLAVLAG